MSITLKNKDILEGQAALGRLDDYRLKGTVLLSLAKVGIALKNAAEPINKSRDAVGKKYFPDGKANQSDPKFKIYADEVLEILEKTTELPVETILTKDLNLEENAIPVSVLITLSWLFVDEPPKTK